MRNEEVNSDVATEMCLLDHFLIHNSSFSIPHCIQSDCSVIGLFKIEKCATSQSGSEGVPLVKRYHYSIR